MSVTVEPRSTLLDTLRNRLDVTGPKRVCDRAELRRLHRDPRRRRGLLLHHAGDLLHRPRGPHAGELRHGEGSVPAAFKKNDALMCGYCTPGFVTACQAWLEKNPGQEPTIDDVKQGLDGNICRCGTYIGVFQAALDAAKAMKKEGPEPWRTGPKTRG